MRGPYGATPRGATLPLLLLALAVTLLTCGGALGAEPGAVSEPGRYSGYSAPAYDGWVRSSLYVTARDGTRLAADIFRPANGGAPAAERLPVIWSYDRYQRAQLKGDRLVTQLDQEPWLQTVIRYGYVVGVVDARGAGASFGTRRGTFTRQEAFDAYDVTEWFAAQPWCSGRVGMFGRSYMGIIQYMAASTRPPHLKAVFPEMAFFDLHEFVHPGGVFRQDFLDGWGSLVARLDTDGLAAPVEGAQGAEQLAAAVEQHRANRDILDIGEQNPFRDSRDAKAGVAPYADWSPSTYLKEIRRSGVAIYHLAGWYDPWVRDAFVWFKNLDNPQKVIVGPWYHGESQGLDLAAEHLRWYDYWLKGIDNGVMAEPPIHYLTMGADSAAGAHWRAAKSWPPAESAPLTLYFAGGAQQGGEPSAGGALAASAPSQADAGRDECVVDYAATSGTSTRWSKGYGGGGPVGYGNMERNDRRGLSYTSPPLAAEAEVTGHPVVHLWAASTARDGDFFVYLEEVSPEGYSRYVTEGVLRASRRRTSPPPFDYLGLPYRSGLARDVEELPADGPTELVFDLHPTSYRFARGSRIRISVTGADRDNARTPELSPAPRMILYRDAAHPSLVVLPVYAEAGAATAAPAFEFLDTAAAAGRTVSWRPALYVLLLATLSASAVLTFRRVRRGRA